jgi:hypothetical protein
MQDTVKSVMSCGWAIAVFGAKQVTALLCSPIEAQAQVADAFDKLTETAIATFDDSTMTLYRAGESVQNAAINVMMAGVEGFGNPTQWVKKGAESMKRAGEPGLAAKPGWRTAEAHSQAKACQGWGTMPQ